MSTVYEQDVHMKKFKKERKTVFIDEGTHYRILKFIETHPGSGYKKIGEFVNTVLENEVKRLESKAVLEEIGEMGVANWQDRFTMLESRMFLLMYDYGFKAETVKKMKGKLGKMKRELKEKH